MRGQKSPLTLAALVMFQVERLVSLYFDRLLITGHCHVAILCFTLPRLVVPSKPSYQRTVVCYLTAAL